MAHALFILGELSDQDVDWLTDTGRREQVPAGTVLIQEGRPVTTLYVLLDGALEVAVSAAKDQQVARLARGEIVGEMSFVDARPPSATVSALEDSVVLSIPRPVLIEKLEREAGFAARFYRAIAMSLSHRLREMDAAVAEGEFGINVPDPDELDPNVLDTVYLAGQRFERVLKRLAGSKQ